jgi:hypothetical protein
MNSGGRNTLTAAEFQRLKESFQKRLRADPKMPARYFRVGIALSQGVGSKGRENGNHLAGILKYEGPQAHQKELRRIWKETPDHARKIGLPEPERLSA